MVNTNTHKRRILGLRIYSGFLALTTAFGMVYFGGSIKLVSLFFGLSIFILLLFFCFATNLVIFSKNGKLVNYIFCFTTISHLIYEILRPREFITITDIINSQIFYIIAAALWWLLIRKIIANNVASTKNTS